MTEQVIEILKAVGVYQQAREKVSSDNELMELFCDRFGDLVAIVQNGTASGGSIPGRP